MVFGVRCCLQTTIIDTVFLSNSLEGFSPYNFSLGADAVPSVKQFKVSVEIASFKCLQ